MFAVPGWSVSASSLKAEVQGPAGSKKRKRGNKDASETLRKADQTVKGANVQAVKKADGKVKKQKKTERKEGFKERKGLQGAHAADSQSKSPGNKQKEHKQKKPKLESNEEDGSREQAPTTTEKLTAPQEAPKAIIHKKPAAPKLTPLQASMREKLISARFRHLNETLYTKPSAQAFELFKDSPEMFDEYHEGFRRQVQVWPENPVDSFLADIRTRGKVRAPGRHQKSSSSAGSKTLASTPLPRTAGTCTIADLGCGDARLAESLQSAQGKMHLDVKSFDLQSPSPLVTTADIANLPLEDGSTNVAIFCLALMGTNWVDFVEEAYRILHWKGELWVAEIKSRFGPIRGKGSSNVVSHSVGNRKRASKAASAGPGRHSEVADGAADLAVEVDGVEDRRRETDVSAFVEVLKKRGFVLQGEKSEAVDMTNRMFVKMHFIKGATPTVGKGVKEQESAPVGKKGKIRWTADGSDEKDTKPENENTVLKPCVYKIR